MKGNSRPTPPSPPPGSWIFSIPLTLHLAVTALPTSNSTNPPLILSVSTSPGFSFTQGPGLLQSSHCGAACAAVAVARVAATHSPMILMRLIVYPPWVSLTDIGTGQRRCTVLDGVSVAFGRNVPVRSGGVPPEDRCERIEQ